MYKKKQQPPAQLVFTCLQNGLADFIIILLSAGGRNER